MSVSWMLKSGWVFGTELRPRERWSRERLLRYQDKALRRMLHHAVARSPFYRERYAGIDLDRCALTDLPPVDKGTLMAHFDDAVTDRRLHLDDLRRHLETAGGSDLYLDQYMILATSGSSGVRGIFPYTPRAVATYLAEGARVMAMNKIRTAFPLRSAWVAGSQAAHGTYRTAAISDGGPVTSRAFSADTPLPDLVDRLNRFQPHSLSTYPTALLLLAGEQSAGRLHIAPRVVGIGGEVRMPGLDEALARAWPGVPVMESYAMTELGMAGGSCPVCGGIHLFEDLAIFEVLDAAGRPARPGETGARLLVTNLYNPVLPLIRYELTDLVTLASRPNTCGRPWLTLSAVDGRADEVLWLPGLQGPQVAVAPSTFRNVLGHHPAVAEYQVTQETGQLDVAVVLRPDIVGSEWATDLEAQLLARLSALGVAAPPVHVRPVAELIRQNGKLKLVRSLGTRDTTSGTFAAN